MDIILRQSFRVDYQYPVIFTRGLFRPENDVLSGVLTRRETAPHRILIIIDSQVIQKNRSLIGDIELYGKCHADAVQWVSSPVSLEGGEGTKQGWEEITKIHGLVDAFGLCRHSFILTLGGGAVLDVTGFAAATAHRGIRLIRVPTTFLSMADSGVGVKNGFNAFGRKNFVGTFSPPFAVINDLDLLNTLPAREFRSGIAEAIKAALIKDRNFFDSLYENRHKLAQFDRKMVEGIIVRCAELHLNHIGKGGDPFELGSARPLDFGHWIAHKVEEMTFGEVTHGEAVSVGMALDSFYSFQKGLLSALDAERILSLLEETGLPVYHRCLNEMNIPQALSEFQQHLGGELSVPLLTGIGSYHCFHEVDIPLYRSCIRALRSRAKEKSHDLENTSPVCQKGLGQLFP